ncbi:uncharacterized protein K452DRAFT_302007 [Aplosporella prunicola CBS 121167]|uniref:Heterokaryon incompatibility domain-containing protein n=1 Tax=Aplosporella prunicola CBS 121167 TaxID=1176127 RepID=A0A6A6B3X6_9PEZI|nr:uncharacterized protein K452DRAFT_302007 [Aplosporella prunicola CBS 121167]KAF2137431.1 hypothetical protein K452DRAFT_302007 [Aplosporella prunicola CBS 121167]
MEIESTTWNSRGWCLQERYLSPRLVYFSELQVHLESKDIHRSLAQYRELKSQYDWIESFKENPRLRGHSFQLKKRQVPILVRWWEYVTEYSKRNLTKAEDKPIAIDGLAKLLISENTPQDALPTVGEIEDQADPQFSDTFTLDLLWYVERGKRSRPKPVEPEKSSPSWSWISVDGEVFNDSAGSSCTNTLIKDVEFKTSIFHGKKANDWKTVTPMLLSGRVGLKLHGRLRKAKWSKPANDLFYAPRQSSAEALFYYNDVIDKNITIEGKGNAQIQSFTVFKPVSDVEHVGPAVYHLLDNQSTKVGWVVPDTDDELPGQLYCLQFLIEPATELEKKSLASTWTIRGLVLQSSGQDTDSPNPRHFKRVGYFELDQPPCRIRIPSLMEFLENNKQEWKSRYPVVREPPAIDPAGFFSEGNYEEREIVIW